MTEPEELAETPEYDYKEYLETCFGESPELIPINKYPFKVGRAHTCDFVIEPHHLPQPNLVSKEHFVLTKDTEKNQICITNVSKNGILVNNQRLKSRETMVLSDGFQIKVCSNKAFIFRYNTDKLPDTRSPMASYENEENYKPILPVWGRLISCLMNLDDADLNTSSFKVGRSSECDYKTDHQEVLTKSKYNEIISKVHFILHRDELNQVAYIEDFSKNGTFLNDKLIGYGNRNILQNEDIISIGGKIGTSPNSTLIGCGNKNVLQNGYIMSRKRQRLRLFLYKRMYSQEVRLPPELFNKYEPTILLGKGGAGEVRLCYEKTTCKTYAIKKIIKGRSTTSQMGNLNHPQKIRAEISILRSLSHPFVISTMETVETIDEVYLVLEYMRGGELTNLILSRDPLTESQVKFLFLQMVLAVQFLHQNGITHRDLKPENILLATEEVETLIKVSDFGLSKVIEGDDGLMETICGTLRYIAPEILNGRPYDKQVDVWSLGVILFYMLARQLPFGTAQELLKFRIQRGFYNIDDLGDVSTNARDLITKMLVVQSKKRIKIDEILKHPWISKDGNVMQKVEDLLNNSVQSENEEMFKYYSDISPKRPRLLNQGTTTL